jgi:hypothetical protein
MLPPARGRARAAAVAAVLIVTLAGCGDDDPKASSDRSASPSATSSSTASSKAPSPTATVSSAAASPTKSSGGPLLSADEVPGFGAGYRWRIGSTSSSEPRQFGTCQKFGILAIGAERVTVRQFQPADTSVAHAQAAELVATFPDAMTARRAYSVLESWHEQCASQLRRYARPQVGGLRSVAVDGGQATWYLLTYSPDKASHTMLLDAQGMALVGRRIAMLRMTRLATEGDQVPPMGKAVAAAASRL